MNHCSINYAMLEINSCNDVFLVLLGPNIHPGTSLISWKFILGRGFHIKWIYLLFNQIS